MADRKFAKGGVVRGPVSRDDDQIMALLWNDCPLIPARVAEQMREQERREVAKGGD